MSFFFTVLDAWMFWICPLTEDESSTLNSLGFTDESTLLVDSDTLIHRDVDMPVDLPSTGPATWDTWRHARLKWMKCRLGRCFCYLSIYRYTHIIHIYVCLHTMMSVTLSVFNPKGILYREYAGSFRLVKYHGLASMIRYPQCAFDLVWVQGRCGRNYMTKRRLPWQASFGCITKKMSEPPKIDYFHFIWFCVQLQMPCLYRIIDSVWLSPWLLSWGLWHCSHNAGLARFIKALLVCWARTDQPPCRPFTSAHCRWGCLDP